MAAISSCLFPVTQEGSTGNINMKVELEEIKRMMKNCANSIIFAGKISSSLALQGRYDLLQEFLHELGADNIESLKSNEQFLRALVALNFEKKNFQEVYSLLKKGKFTSYHGLLEVWDEAHYKEKESELGKPLSPLIKFRVRKRNPPPPNICATGQRPSSKLSEEAKEILKTWFVNNTERPYPSQETRNDLANKAGLTAYQVKTWFANARRRMKTMSNQYSYEKQRKDISSTGDKNTITCPCALQTSPFNFWKHQVYNPWANNPISDRYDTAVDTCFGLPTIAKQNYAIYPQLQNDTKEMPQHCLMELASLCAQLSPCTQKSYNSPVTIPELSVGQNNFNIAHMNRTFVRQSNDFNGQNVEWNGSVASLDLFKPNETWTNNSRNISQTLSNIDGTQYCNPWNTKLPSNGFELRPSTAQTHQGLRSSSSNGNHGEGIGNLQGQGYSYSQSHLVDTFCQDVYDDPFAEYFIKSESLKSSSTSQEVFGVHHEVSPLAPAVACNVDGANVLEQCQQAAVDEMEAAEILLDLSMPTHQHL